mmetsp:Transcript_690/g.1800  ORF Transcript_690/g.1800 Transcript_690/m.1800 type:complete len:235 (-) Transcript_690:126-830(-)
MGGKLAVQKPGTAFGGFAYALEAQNVDSAPAFVVPPLREDASAPKPEGAADDKASGTEVVWEDCALREVLSREQLEAVIRKINALILPTVFEARVAEVSADKKTGVPKFNINVNGDIRDGNGGMSVLARYTHFNVAFLANAAQEVLRSIAAPLPGVDAVTLQVAPGEMTRSSGQEAKFFLVFLLTEELGRSTGGAGGPAVGDGSDAGGKALIAALGLPPPSSHDPPPDPSAPGL